MSEHEEQAKQDETPDVEGHLKKGHARQFKNRARQ
jgi:hypothetical protein